MSKSERRKGNRVECEIVNAHKEFGIHAERYPLSGASHFRGQGYDIDVYAFGRDNAPAVAEVKARANGEGFATLERWLGTYDILVLKRDRQDPLVVMPWSFWRRLLRCVNGLEATDGTPRDKSTKSRRAQKPAQGTATQAEKVNGRAEAR